MAFILYKKKYVYRNEAERIYTQVLTVAISQQYGYVKFYIALFVMLCCSFQILRITTN